VASNSYSDLVAQLKNISPNDQHFARRLNELISINELLTTLNTARTLEETLEIMLLTILGQYVCLKGAVFIKGKKAWRVGISKGVKPDSVKMDELPLDASWDKLPAIIHSRSKSEGNLVNFWKGDLFRLVLPIRSEGKLVGLICLGKSMLGDGGREKEPMLATIADLSGVLISNSLYRDDLINANRQLQRQIFQLNTLYEITGAFARCYDDDAVFQILSNNLMGQFFISRCAVLSICDDCHVIFRKGLKNCPEHQFVGNCQSLEPLDLFDNKVLDLRDVASMSVLEFMKAHRLHYALPIASEGERYGLLLLGERLDRRELKEADKDFVLSLAQQSAVALANVRLQKEALEKQRMERELELAREIQQQLLPKSVPNLPGYDIAAEMRPYYQVGGDFYDFIAHEEGRLTICLADVSGKSLPASMIMSTAQASLRGLNAFGGRSPKEIIEKLNLHLSQSTQSNKFVTMFYAVLDPRTHELTYINAGHNRPILVNTAGEHELLGMGGMVLGLFPMAKYQVGTARFEPGAELLIYTDGLSEVNDPDGEEYGDDRLIETLIRMRGQGSAVEEKDRMVNEIMDFSAGQMVDDLTLLLIRRRPEA